MNRVVLKNGYGEELCELVLNRNGAGWRVRDEDLGIFNDLYPGDEYFVEEVWGEEYGDEEELYL